MPLDDLARYIGMAVIFVGGPLLALLILILLAWQAFEVIARRVGWTKRVMEWREAAIREKRG